MIFSCSEVVVSSVVDFMTDSNLMDDDLVVILVVVWDVVGKLVSVMVSSMRSVLVIIGRHSVSTQLHYTNLSPSKCYHCMDIGYNHFQNVHDTGLVVLVV